MNLLSWFCCAGSLVVAVLWARGLRVQALWASLVMQLPWAVMGYLAGQWGTVALSFVFVGIDVWGLWWSTAP